MFKWKLRCVVISGSHVKCQNCIWRHAFVATTYTAKPRRQLCCEWELSNVIDRYTVAVKKIQGKLLATCQKDNVNLQYFFQRGGEITATVTGHRRYSSDLVQGGLEIPCNLRFHREDKEILKLKKVRKLKKCLHQLAV